MEQVLDEVKFLQELDDIVTDVESLYVQYGKSLVGSMNLATDGRTKHREVQRFVNDATQTSDHFEFMINYRIDKGLNSIARVANLDSFFEIVSQSIDLAKQNIKRQMFADIMALKTEVLRYSMVLDNENARGNFGWSAFIAAKESIRYQTVDRIGRRLSSGNFIKTSLKAVIIKAIYDGFMIEALKNDKEFVTLSDGKSIVVADYFSEGFALPIHPNTKTLPISMGYVR